MSELNEARRVVIADDEELIASTLATILNQTGFQAIAVYSGEDAVTVADTFQPNVLISDIFMGGISGIEAAIKIRSKCPACEVLLCSGHAGASNLLANAHAQGHDFDFFPKPVHPNVLIARLQGRRAA